jgi:hypothetical protein
VFCSWKTPSQAEVPNVYIYPIRTLSSKLRVQCRCFISSYYLHASPLANIELDVMDAQGSRNAEYLILWVVLGVFATLILSLRLFVRFQLVKQLGLDDYAMVIVGVSLSLLHGSLCIHKSSFWLIRRKKC